jgi:hypothetical protein
MTLQPNWPAPTIAPNDCHRAVLGLITLPMASLRLAGSWSKPRMMKNEMMNESCLALCALPLYRNIE